MKNQQVNKTGLKDSFYPQPKDRVSDHIRIEKRSIALHRAVAERIRTNPRLMEKARENLKKYLAQFAQENRTAPKSLTEWQDILTNRSGEAVLEFLVSSGESAGRLRQSSPFAGILTPKERWKIYEAYRPGAYYQTRPGSGRNFKAKSFDASGGRINQRPHSQKDQQVKDLPQGTKAQKKEYMESGVNSINLTPIKIA